MLSQALPVAAVARLLDWQTAAAQIFADTSIGKGVRAYGQSVRQAERAEVAALRQRDDLATVDRLLVRHEQPRQRVGWPKELTVAVAGAVAADHVCPPSGVSWADWARRNERGWERSWQQRQVLPLVAS